MDFASHSQVIFRYIRDPHHPRHQPLDPSKTLPMIRSHFLPHLPNHPEKLPTRKAAPIPSVQLCYPFTSLWAMVQQPDLRLQSGGIERLHLLRPRAIEEGTILLLPPPPPA